MYATFLVLGISVEPYIFLPGPVELIWHFFLSVFEVDQRLYNNLCYSYIDYIGEAQQ